MAPRRWSKRWGPGCLRSRIGCLGRRVRRPLRLPGVAVDRVQGLPLHPSAVRNRAVSDHFPSDARAGSRGARGARAPRRIWVALSRGRGCRRGAPCVRTVARERTRPVTGEAKRSISMDTSGSCIWSPRRSRFTWQAWSTMTDAAVPPTVESSPPATGGSGSAAALSSQSPARAARSTPRGRSQRCSSVVAAWSRVSEYGRRLLRDELGDRAVGGKAGGYLAATYGPAGQNGTMALHSNKDLGAGLRAAARTARPWSLCPVR